MTLKGGIRGVIFRRISLITLLPFDLYDQIRQDNTCKVGAYFQRWTTPYRKGRGPNATEFGGFPSIYIYTLWRWSIKWRSMGRAWFLDGQPCPHSVPVLVNFGVPFHLHHLSQNYQIWRGNTYGDGACYYGVSQAKWAGSQRSPIFGVHFYLRTPFWLRTTKFHVVTHVGVSHPSHPNRAEFQRSPVLEVLSTPFNAEWPNSAWQHIWGVACFGEMSHAIAFTQMRRTICQR